MCSHLLHGWRFWSLEGDEPKTEAAATPAAEKPAKTRTAKAKKLIYRVPNQQGAGEGKSRWFCSACMKAFLVDAGETPQVCPEGHRNDDPELTAPVAAEAAEAEAKDGEDAD